MRSFAQALSGIALLTLACCGASDKGDGGFVTTASFQIFRNAANQPCRDIPEIERVEVIVYATDGVTRRPGYPIAGDCSTGQVSLPNLEGGRHVLEILARGRALSADDAVLFKAKQEIDLPNTIDLSLRPEVSFLTVHWAFQDEGAGVCANEVGEVEVLLAASGGQVTFGQRVPCVGSPLVIPLPLPILNFMIRIDAYSFSDFPLYTATVPRVLERGEDEVNVTLMPLGSVVLLDWQFEVGSTSIRPCDNARVDVATIDVSIGNVNSTQRAVERVECEAFRPYAFRADRFQAGQTLEIDIVAEGAARFLGHRIVNTTGEDLTVPTIVLEAVGTASTAFTVATATCAAASYDRFQVAAVNIAEAQLNLSFDLPADASMAVFEDLPYGEYEVFIVQLSGTTPVCGARGHGTIDDRVNAWPALRL